MKTYYIEEIVGKAVDCPEDSRESFSYEMYEVALNRSYYTMFHCIQALLFTKNITIKSHKGYHNAFHKDFILPGT